MIWFMSTLMGPSPRPSRETLPPLRMTEISWWKAAALPDISRPTSKPSVRPCCVHDLVQILVRGVDGGVDAHFAGQVKPVVVHVGDDDAARARVFADAAGDNADGARAGDEHVLADERGT